MSILRQSLLSLAAGLLVAGSVAGSGAVQAQAQDYPNRPVTIVLPFPPGGPSDTFARALSQKLNVALKQPFIVENRAGATGLIGSGVVQRAKPDGYTVLLTSNSAHVIAPLLRPKAPYDPVDDFEPVTILGSYAFCLTANNAVPAANARELVSLLKKNPGKTFFGTIGEGSATHLMAELFKQQAGVDMVHVPYKGGGAVTTALIAGEVQLFFDGVGSAKKFVDAGRVKAIAVSGKQRSPLLPNVPTLAEAGIQGLDATVWLGVFAPKGTPAPVVQTLYREIRKILDTDPEVRKLFADTGTEILATPPAEVAAALRSEQRSWKALIERLNIRVND